MFYLSRARLCTNRDPRRCWVWGGGWLGEGYGWFREMLGGVGMVGVVRHSLAPAWRPHNIPVSFLSFQADIPPPLKGACRDCVCVVGRGGFTGGMPCSLIYTDSGIPTWTDRSPSLTDTSWIPSAHTNESGVPNGDHFSIVYYWIRMDVFIHVSAVRHLKSWTIPVLICQPGCLAKMLK